MTIVKAMKTMGAGKFKAECLAVMEEVKNTRTSVLITKYGKPVAKLVPVEEEEGSIFGFLRGKATIVGDLVHPVVAAEDWG